MVAFAEPDDMTLLGAHGLEGLNLRVDLVARALVPAGSVPAALRHSAQEDGATSELGALLAAFAPVPPELRHPGPAGYRSTQHH